MNDIPGMVDRLSARCELRALHSHGRAYDRVNEAGEIEHIPLPDIDALLALANERERGPVHVDWKHRDGEND